MDKIPCLPPGYSAVAPGHIATVVTSLQMFQRPAPRPGAGLAPGLQLNRLERPSIQRYRHLYRAVGQDWLWFSRLVMADDKLAAILADPLVQIYALQDGQQDLGILELDFRVPGECELAFFGLTPAAVGTGTGRALMNEALALAWSQPINRLWVHTCTLDHPAALAFYRRSGFTPYAVQVETGPDPRLAGTLPRDCASHVPIIEPAGTPD
jgi:GNAT superfamily N-acetyltransferase